ncbi:MAG TPA: hypothetical protein VFT22_29100 [Kofleriaceae bacterium]|nr:hypothetical protein [Kofleriaceae bacterium]
MTRSGSTVSLVALLVGTSAGVAACSDGIDDAQPETPLPGSTAGSDGNTFDHDNDGVSVWDLVDRLAREGPPDFTSRVHSCSKIRIATLANVLASLGVNLTTPDPGSAGALFNDPGTPGALGAASYANRIRENIGITTSGASRLFDIFAAGADEITAAIPNLERCQDASGAPSPPLFDASNRCNPRAITCLIGQPAQQGHVDVCNLSVTNASDPAIGKRLAVAALLAAAYTCE